MIGTLEVLARIVSIADEIREGYKAQGAEAERLFEEAVTRNGKRFRDMINDLGGMPPLPTTDPATPPPVVPPPSPTPQPTTAPQYRVPFAVPVPTDDQLKGLGYRLGDAVLLAEDGAHWMMNNVRIGINGYDELRRVT